MSKKDDSKLWLILGNEELPLGISVAKTANGAKRIYNERTGKSRDVIHVEELKFHKQFVAFTPLI
jgi:hypothetical protein